jgi:phosphoglycerol transferase MdoB-like AlkP superfamily enzyme
MTYQADGLDERLVSLSTGMQSSSAAPGNRERTYETGRSIAMHNRKDKWYAVVLLLGAIVGLSVAHTAWAQDKKPNILVIMGDDLGMWNIGAYHRGLMAGRTPNLDKLAKEGMLFTDYYAEASCTAGRANFITGELPIRTA